MEQSWCGSRMDWVQGTKPHSWEPIADFFADEKMEQALDALVVPLIHAGNIPSEVFMNDNAPPYRANATRQFLKDHNILTLAWPFVRTDMNPIENMWSLMKRELKLCDFAHNSDASFLKHCVTFEMESQRLCWEFHNANGSYAKYRLKTCWFQNAFLFYTVSL